MVSDRSGGVFYSRKKFSVEMLNIEDGVSEDKLVGLALKQIYIDNKNLDCNGVYRKIFSDDNRRLKVQKKIYALPPFSRFILERISISNICYKRKRNGKVLRDLLAGCKGMRPVTGYNDGMIPFTLPVYVDKRDKLRRFLTDNMIYCAVHWPLEESAQRTAENIRINKHIISLNIDQRYQEEHMLYIIEKIKAFENRRDSIS